MTERESCPECGSVDTDRVFVNWLSDGLHETRVCNDCPAQYTLKFHDPVVDVDEPGGEQA